MTTYAGPSPSIDSSSNISTCPVVTYTDKSDSTAQTNIGAWLQNADVILQNWYRQVVGVDDTTREDNLSASWIPTIGPHDTSEWSVKCFFYFQYNW